MIVLAADFWKFSVPLRSTANYQKSALCLSATGFLKFLDHMIDNRRIIIIKNFENYLSFIFYVR
jgi:hypothetical protein